MNLIGSNPFMDLKESIAYVHARDKERAIEYPRNEFKSLDCILLEYYRESKLVSLNYRDKNKVYAYTGMIERIDLIYKEIYFLPKKKIAFRDIIGIKSL